MNALILASLLGTALIGQPSAEQTQDSQLPTVPKVGEEVAVMETAQGQIVLMFYPQKAPLHVANFKMLAKKKFYDGTRFHRTLDKFMIQGGCPNSKDLFKSLDWGTGGNLNEDKSRANVKAEFTDLKHTRGVLSMARSSSPNSASSQFFIMHADYPSLDGSYSAFGRVVSGLEVVDKIVSAPGGGSGVVKPNLAVVIKTVRIEKWPLKK